MKNVIRWAIRNSPAMNTVLIATLAVGALSLLSLRREVFPEFDLEMILVTVPYPGASPEEVEDGICQKLEEAVRSIDGIKKQTAVAKEGAGSLVLELETTADPRKVLAEVRSEIDRIPSLPALAEDPEVKQVTMRQPAIHVGVAGPDRAGPVAERELRDIAEQVRDDLIRLPEVSQANISGAKDYQIDVEISEETLRKHGLTLRGVAQTLRRENLEMPGGTIKTDAQDILVKGENKSVVGHEIANIPLLTQSNGAVLTVGDLGVVRDEFADTTSYNYINGQPGMVISVDRTSEEDLLAMTDAVHAYVKSKSLPAGYRLLTWGDRSIEVRDRMDLLGRNGFQGLVLVLVVLALFLDSRLAWWVALGIPVSILGAGAVLYATGETLNMLTMFAFLMALGIVVDDAIVIGENIYSHREAGATPFRAAVDGTLEVLPSVAASVSTTVIAFMPLFYVSGVMGKFIAVMPLAMIAMLLISLVESTFILPCHLAHRAEGSLLENARSYRDSLDSPALRWTIGSLAVFKAQVLTFVLYPFWPVGWFFRRATVWSNAMLARMAELFYLPSLRFAVRNPAIAVSASLVILMLTVGLVRAGKVPFIIFPKLDSNTINASVSFPDGTPADVTDQATLRIEQAIREMNEAAEKNGEPLLELTRRAVGQVVSQGGPGQTSEASGGHLGSVTVELVDTSRRTMTSQEITTRWRERVGGIPGAESVNFGSSAHGPGGTPIEFKMLADSNQILELEKAVEEAKQKLRGYPGVIDVEDDSTPGKLEMQLRVKESAIAMGVPLAELAETVRASYYGEEAMRLQRGRHEVKLMVRYPREQRRSLADFDQIRVRADDGAERPLTELAHVRVTRGLSEINRVDQQRSVTISADVNEAVANARNVVADLRRSFMPGLLEKYPAVRVRWEGQQEQTTESVQSLMVGFVVALLCMFVLLTLQFESYLQPALIMAIIPFGAVGAIGGHLLMGMPLTLFSLFGLVALTGVVVNDSIVLIDFINHRVRDGRPLEESLLDAGRQRLRPVLLTSITTVAGLLPLLLETSFQAQILVPMAVSLAFGLMLGTFLILLLIPSFYSVYARLVPAAVVHDGDDDGPDKLSGVQPAGKRDITEPAASDGTGSEERREPVTVSSGV